MASSHLLDELHRIPKPPPLPSQNYGSHKNYLKKLRDCVNLYEKRSEAWDKIFMEGYGADVCVVTRRDGMDSAIEEDHLILAHSCIIGISSPVLRNLLEEAPVKNNFRTIKISCVTGEAARVFIRFLYSSCYEEEEIKNNALHLLVLSHVYSVPSLKNLCVYQIEKIILNRENVVDLLQLARECDTARLAFMCTRFILKKFKNVSVTEGWKVMREINPALEQELLELLVESDSVKFALDFWLWERISVFKHTSISKMTSCVNKIQMKLERLNRREEHKTYFLLYEAMESLVHICQDGCRNIGPADKSLNHIQNRGVSCKFSACKTLELLVRHFRTCEVCVPGGCANCKRMWQLLELHSRMCTESYFCKVPLCRYFKEKMKNLSKKEKQKWDLLVKRVRASKGTLSSICYMRPFSEEKIHVDWCAHF